METPNPAPRRRNLAWLWFSLLRLGLFAVVLLVFVLILPIEPWISTLLAAIVAFCVSYIFFTKPRAAVSEQIDGARRSSGRNDDSDAEDQVTADGVTAGEAETDSEGERRS